MDKKGFYALAAIAISVLIVISLLWFWITRPTLVTEDNLRQLTMRQLLSERNVVLPLGVDKDDMVFKYISSYDGSLPRSWERIWANGQNQNCALWTDHGVIFFLTNFPPPPE